MANSSGETFETNYGNMADFFEILGEIGVGGLTRGSEFTVFFHKW
jgi:hypothetical protein